MYMVRRSRTPQGVRGLKLDSHEEEQLKRRRTPQGVRGLKLFCWLWGYVPLTVALRKECVD